MNRKRVNDSYNRAAVGIRIQNRRALLNISQEELAERIDRATKYCSDIERGICGMSIETMLAFAKELDMSLDYMMFGGNLNDKKDMETVQMAELLHILSKCSSDEQSYAVKLLTLFLAAVRGK
ncbi:MAG: helix-turn-helix transcriptional regulator [Lachnospiraceae bacterium]|nr:helix-turn-helix transcriptional regulator [Lachnospiraceae bacterium]